MPTIISIVLAQVWFAHAMGIHLGMGIHRGMTSKFSLQTQSSKDEDNSHLRGGRSILSQL